MTAAIGIYTFIPPLADLATDTHVFHAGWMPHARMHTVWLLGATSSIGLVALFLIWVRKIDQRFNIRLAGTLSLCVFGSFYLSALTAPLYGGRLSDMVGGIEQGAFGLDANLLVFTFASIVLGIGWALCERSPGLQV